MIKFRFLRNPKNRIRIENTESMINASIIDLSNY
jgi:hypothetical protein